MLGDDGLAIQSREETMGSDPQWLARDSGTVGKWGRVDRSNRAAWYFRGAANGPVCVSMDGGRSGMVCDGDRPVQEAVLSRTLRLTVVHSRYQRTEAPCRRPVVNNQRRKHALPRLSAAFPPHIHTVESTLKAIRS